MPKFLFIVFLSSRNFSKYIICLSSWLMISDYLLSIKLLNLCSGLLKFILTTWFLIDLFLLEIMVISSSLLDRILGRGGYLNLFVLTSIFSLKFPRTSRKHYSKSTVSLINLVFWGFMIGWLLIYSFSSSI